MARQPGRGRATVERLEDVVARRLAAWRARLAPGGATGLVVAVSGGGDSVALCRLVAGVAPGLGIPLTVAHLNHGVRGEAAEADSRFVEELAERLDLPFERGNWRPERTSGFEADARKARRAWLVDVARRRGATGIALGHTRDEQAETIAHRLLRGTGPRGLVGMRRLQRIGKGVGRGLWLVRPLLEASREELRDYLRAVDQPWCEDASNDDVRFTRARIRHELMPMLEERYNPRVMEALARLGRLAGRWSRSLDRVAADEERKATIRAMADAVVLDRRILRELDLFLRAEVFRRAWRRRGWPEVGMTASRWERLARAADGAPGRFDVGAKVEAIVELDRLTLRIDPDDVPFEDDGPAGAVEVAIGGRTAWGTHWLTTKVDPSSTEEWAERIDLDEVVPPLRLSAAAPGDRFDPLGLGGHTQRLVDLLRARDVPAALRERVPVLRDARGIVWVVGHRIAHRVRRTEATRHVLGLSWEQDVAGGAEGNGVG